MVGEVTIVVSALSNFGKRLMKCWSGEVFLILSFPKVDSGAWTIRQASYVLRSMQNFLHRTET